MSDNEKRTQQENEPTENKEMFFRWMDLHVASRADYRKRMCKALESELDSKLPGLGIGNLFRIVSPEDLCAIIDKIKRHPDWPSVNKSILSGAANAALNHYKAFVSGTEQGWTGDVPATPVIKSHKPRQAQRRVGVQRINGFKYPSADTIDGRTSTICRSMACTLLERKACRPEEERTWRNFFPEKKCAYCGKPASHLDHLHALIVDRKPTGYGTEPANLVPCCRECNQPKGNMEWEAFMRSDKCRHVGDSQTDNPKEAMKKRIKTIQAFQAAMPPKKVVFDGATIGKWTEILSGFDAKLKEAHDALLGMKKTIYGDEGE